MKTQKLMVVLVVLQGLILLGQWAGPVVQPARAQIPDAGAQQVQIIDELKALNAKTDRLVTLVESGKVQVVVAKSDEAKEK